MMTETAQQLGVERYSVRKPDRIRIILNTKLRLAGQPDMDVFVRNISSRGFMADGLIVRQTWQPVLFPGIRQHLG